MKPDKKGNKNLMGILSLVLWALVATLFINYIFSSYTTATTVEVPYSEFRRMIQRDEVAAVELRPNKYVIHVREGITPKWTEGLFATEEDATPKRPSLFSQEGESDAITYFCAPLNDETLLDLMESRGLRSPPPIRRSCPLWCPSS